MSKDGAPAMVSAHRTFASGSAIGTQEDALAGKVAAMLCVVVIIEPVGAGKTTTMEAVAELLARRGEAVGAVDLDSLRAVWPAKFTHHPEDARPAEGITVLSCSVEEAVSDRP